MSKKLKSTYNCPTSLPVHIEILKAISNTKRVNITFSLCIHSITVTRAKDESGRRIIPAALYDDLRQHCAIRMKENICENANLSQ